MLEIQNITMKRALLLENKCDNYQKAWNQGKMAQEQRTLSLTTVPN
jgi:hypothetical protein